MARRPRRELTDGVFHTTARGTNRTRIVEDAIDCDAFTSLLRRVARLWTWRLYAFCVMPNHHHIVVAATLEHLSRGMHALNGQHATRFNRRHGRTGHLFQERFDARLIETDAYLEHACRYVLDNPVRAGLAQHAQDWAWSGGEACHALDGSRSRP
jgi:putative transposase